MEKSVIEQAATMVAMMRKAGATRREILRALEPLDDADSSLLVQFASSEWANELRAQDEELRARAKRAEELSVACFVARRDYLRVMYVHETSDNTKEIARVRSGLAELKVLEFDLKCRGVELLELGGVE